MATTPTPTPTRPTNLGPAQKSNLLWWLLGLGGAAMVLLIVGGLLVAGFFVRSLRVTEKGREVEISTPAGSLSVSKAKVKDVGLPIYPGSVLVEEGGNVQITVPEETRVGIAVVRYRSNDAVEKVDAWYRARLGPEFERDMGDTRGKIRARGVMTEGIAYVSDRDDLVRFVAISKKFRGAEIALGRIGQQEAQ